MTPVIRNDEGATARSHRPAFIRAREAVLALHARLRALRDGEYARGKIAGLEVALALFDAAEADRETGVVTDELLRSVVEHHERVASDRSDVAMSLVPTADLDHVRLALEAALSLIAKRPAVESPDLADRVRALVGREAGRPCCVSALRAEALPADVTGRPRVPGPAL